MRTSRIWVCLGSLGLAAGLSGCSTLGKNGSVGDAGGKPYSDQQDASPLSRLNRDAALDANQGLDQDGDGYTVQGGDCDDRGNC